MVKERFTQRSLSWRGIIGIDVIPAKAGQAGYLEAWWFPHDADDITILFAIPGAPALPMPPTDTIEV